MNLRKRDFFLFILSCAVLPAWAVRDPFWPIGYEPPKPKMPKTATTDAVPQKKLPPKVVTPVIKPITEEDWGKASKALIINGFTQSVRPDTGETRTQVMINRRTYAPGATLSITNADIHFTWRIESLADRDLKLKQIKAARIITDRSSNLNQ